MQENAHATPVGGIQTVGHCDYDNDSFLAELAVRSGEDDHLTAAGNRWAGI